MYFTLKINSDIHSFITFITVLFCTVDRYTHKQDWINMRPQDRTILITK